MTKLWLSVSEVADRLECSPKTAYTLINRGDIPHYRLAGGIKVKPADLDAYIAGRYHGGPAAKPAITAEHSPGDSSPGDDGGEPVSAPPPSSAP